MALAAIEGGRTLAQIADRFDVHPNQVTSWTAQLECCAPAVFGPRGGNATAQRRRPTKDVSEEKPLIIERAVRFIEALDEANHVAYGIARADFTQMLQRTAGQFIAVIHSPNENRTVSSLQECLKEVVEAPSLFSFRNSVTARISSKALLQNGDLGGDSASSQAGLLRGEVRRRSRNVGQQDGLSVIRGWRACARR